MIKAIFFDTSDTLYESNDFAKAQSNRAYELLAKKLSISDTEAKSLFKEKQTELKHSLEHVAKAHVLAEFGITRDEFQSYLAEMDPGEFLGPDPELDKLLSRLAQRFELGIVSNVSQVLVLKTLKVMTVSSTHFTHFVTSDNTINAKPHPESFLKALELSKVAAKEVLYVGPSYTKDILPAKRAGMRTLWLTEEEDKKEANSIIRTIREIEKIIS